MFVRFVALLASTACACVATAGATARTLDSGTIRVEYIESSSLQFQDANGNPIKSLAAGSYQVLVDDPDDSNPMFTMNGPGVSVSSNLNSSGMGIDRPAFFGPFNFQAGATYTASDTNMGPASTISLSVTAGGSVSGGSSSSGSGSSSSVGTTSSSSSSSGSSSSGGKTSVASSSSSGTAGTLAGTVSAAGKATLTFGGRIVKTLKAGVYELTVADHSKRAQLIVEKVGFPAMTEGATSHKLTLSSGRWFFKSSTGSQKEYFKVT